MTVWYDLSTALSSNGMTGTVRVELELCRALLESRRDVRLFNATKRGFEEVTQAQEPWVFHRSKRIGAAYLEALAEEQGTSANADLDADYQRIMRYAETLAPTTVQRLSTITSIAVSSLPAPIAEVALSTLGPHSAASVEVVRRLFTAKKQPKAAPAPVEAELEHPFRDGDVVISLGIDWGSRFIRAIRDIKKQVKLRYLLSVADVSPILVPQYHNALNSTLYAEFYRQACLASDLIVYCSRHSENDGAIVQDRYGLKRVPSALVYWGGEKPGPAAQTPAKQDAFLTKAKITGEYMLFVSTIEARKNHETVYLAYRELVKKHGKTLPKLVFAGRPGWKRRQFLEAVKRDPVVHGQLIIVSPDDAELDTLYRRCRFTLYPSLYEGWGLPMIESRDHGKLVLASDAASLREAAGDLSVLVDAYSPSAWARAMEQYLFDDAELKRREQAIAERHHVRPWSACAEEFSRLVEAP